MAQARDPELQKKIGARLRAVRLKKELSQVQLSYLSDIDRRQIIRIEKGELNMSIGTLACLAKALEIDIKDLFS